MIVVFDSNVIIAALIAHGTSAEVFEHALANHEVAVGPFIVAEVLEKLAGKFAFGAARVAEVESFLSRHTRRVDAVALPSPVCRDPDDDNVLAIATAAGAAAIVTGDRDLLDLGAYGAIAIVRPSDFWAFERRG